MRFGRYEKKKGLFGLGKGTSYSGVASHPVTDFDFVSTGSESDLKISVEQLENPPACPYCGNSNWGMCTCSRIHCFPSKFEGTVDLTCSWCNQTNTYGMGNFDVGRGRG